MQAFPGAEIVGIRNLAQPEATAEPAPDDDSDEE
jgi:hypothetical protein